MVRSNPGYIPYNYKYDMKQMSERDLIIYEMLKTAMYSTHGQQREMFASGGMIHGSFSRSDSNGFSYANMQAYTKKTFTGNKGIMTDNRLSMTQDFRDAATTYMPAPSQRSKSDASVADDG